MAARIPKHEKKYRFADETQEAIKRLCTLDPDLSENQAVARNLRIMHKTIEANLPPDLLAKYEQGTLTRIEMVARREELHLRKEPDTLRAVKSA
jgi:hypothetical protein